MIHKIMRSRDHHEPHRVATTLELYFDLVFVIAIAATASGLHHALAAHHFSDGLIRFATSFFCVWWAWMNFTWFASAYDNDDFSYRIVTMVQMFGAIILAIGINNVFEHNDYTMILIGYIVMRIAMAYQWFRAAKSDPERRMTCLRYAFGIIIAQLFWAIIVIYIPHLFNQIFLFGALLELSVPVWAESANKTAWHPHHIAERYGLLVIIVLGEGILGATNAITPLFHSNEAILTEAFPLGLGISALMFSLWWLYFKMPWGEFLHSQRTLNNALVYGYGHLLIFIALTALGSGLELLADSVKEFGTMAEVAEHSTNAHSVSPLFAMTALSLCTAIYLIALAFLRWYLDKDTNYSVIGFTLAIAATFLGVLCVYLGMPLQWSIWFTVIAPIAMISFYKTKPIHLD